MLLLLVSVFCVVSVHGRSSGPFSLILSNQDSMRHRVCVYMNFLNPGVYANVIAWRVLDMPHNSTGTVQFIADFQTSFTNFNMGSGVTGTAQGPQPIQLGRAYQVGDNFILSPLPVSIPPNDMLLKLYTTEYSLTSVNLFVSTGSGYKLAATKVTEPGLSAGFTYHPTLYVAIVQDVVEGNPITSDVQSDSVSVQYDETHLHTVTITKQSGRVTLITS